MSWASPNERPGTWWTWRSARASSASAGKRSRSACNWKGRPFMDPSLYNQVRQDLQHFEGYREHVYQDTQHHPTIGFGTNLDEAYNQHLLAQLGYDVQAVQSGRQTISEEDA